MEIMANLDELNVQIDRLLKEVGASRAVLAKLNAKISQLQKENKSYTKDIQRLQEDLSLQHSEISDMSTRIANTLETVSSGEPVALVNPELEQAEQENASKRADKD